MTTNTSHFLMETTATNVTVANNGSSGNHTYVVEGLEWKCACDAYYSNRTRP
jgi:hypothetical protein